MFILNGKALDVHSQVTIGSGDEAVTFPVGFFLDAEARAQYGIEEVAQEVRPDDRIYFVSDKGDGTFGKVAKNLDEVKKTFVAAAKAGANAMLAATDWMVIRKAERGVEIPADVAAYRQAVVDAVAAYETAVLAAADVEAVAALQAEWPEAQAAA